MTLNLRKTAIIFNKSSCSLQHSFAEGVFFANREHKLPIYADLAQTLN